MVDVLIGASLLTAFIAGIAALFAPCCITVLLPAYLGSVFRQRRTVFLMTFIFFLGLLAVFLPLGLGIAGLGQFFSRFHDQIFIAGGLFLLFLGASILLGKRFSMPFSVSPTAKTSVFAHGFASQNHGMNVTNASSVFVLGIFSGFATLCCAPVLAGALALSILPGSIFWGGIYSLTYVLGMVAPLFVISYYLDKGDVTKMLSKARRHYSYSLFGRRVGLTPADILSGGMFVLMGVLIIYLSSTNQLVMGGGDYQMTINIFLANVTNFANKYLAQVPAVAWVVAIGVAIALIIRTAFGGRRRYG